MKKLIVMLLAVCGAGCADMAILNTFNAGELSPHMDARLDFQKYQSGLRTLENFVVLPYGGAQKRPGTQYIAETKSDGVARLAPFSVGVDQSYILELGVGYIRFYQAGIQLESGGVPVEVVTPYTADDVFEVQLAQFADTVYMTHPDHPPQKLQRTTTAPTFTIEEVDFAYPPLLDENLVDTTIQASGTTGSVTITASAAIFTTNHVGSDWACRTARTDGNIEGTKSADYISPAIRVEGDWNLKTSDAWTGTLKLQVSEDGQQTWGDYRSYISADDANYDRSGTETEEGVFYRLAYDHTGGSITYRFQNDEPYLSGWFSITNYTSPTVVTAVVQTKLGSTNATEFWSEGAFSDERGYPRSCEFYENRLFFAATDYQVNTIWASKTDDYESFKTGTYDDSSMRLSINSDNIIEWMLGRSQLFIGTLGDEWILSGGDSSTPLTPTSILARKQTAFGSKDGIDALIASDSILYLQRQGRKLREFEYSLESDSYKSTDTTMLAEHITKGGVVQIAEQQQPEPIIWCIRGDGQLIGLTYSKIQNIFGWHRHITDGEFESVAVIPSDGEDRVYVVVNRDNGRYIEWFRPVDWGDDDDAWFVDSGLDWDGGDTVDFTGVSITSNNLALITANNSFSDGDSVVISCNDGVEGFDGFVAVVTNATSTNFLTDFVYTPTVIVVEGAGTTSADGNYVLYSTANNRPVWFRSPVIPIPDHYYLEYRPLDFIPVSNGWAIVSGVTGDTEYRIVSDDWLPPISGWSAHYGSAPAPTFSYDLAVMGTVQEVKNTFTNVSHLAGQTLDIFADGGAAPDENVSAGGVLTTDEYYNRVIAGLPYTARLSPMYIEVVNQQGFSYGRIKQPYRVIFRLLNSGAFNYGSTTNDLLPVSVRLPSLTAGSPVPFYSGDTLTKPIASTPSTSPEFWVTSDEPLPLELLSLTIFTDVTETE